MRRALRTVAGCALVSFGVARLIGCSGDDEAAAPPDPFAALDGDLPERDLGPDPDADNGDSNVVVVDPPSYCNGIVFYASLDGAYGPERGANTPGSPFGNAALVGGGKFGGATSLIEDGGLGDGAAVYYYTPPDGGVAWLPDKVGTVSLWYRGRVLDETGSPVLWRVTGSIPPAFVTGGGLTLLHYQNKLGLFSSVGTSAPQEILAFPIASVRPYFDASEFNHVVTGWQRGDAATPTAVMMINGGSGKIYGDAGADAPSYADAQPNEAGDLLVPYRASRARGWDMDASPLAFRLGGTGTSAPDGQIDDVAVWNRLLSSSEMEALYAATTSIAETCKLK